MNAFVSRRPTSKNQPSGSQRLFHADLPSFRRKIYLPQTADLADCEPDRERTPTTGRCQEPIQRTTQRRQRPKFTVDAPSRNSSFSRMLNAGRSGQTSVDCEPAVRLAARPEARLAAAQKRVAGSGVSGRVFPGEHQGRATGGTEKRSTTNAHGDRHRVALPL